jgi:resuscitation-promoting factor RpfB
MKAAVTACAASLVIAASACGDDTADTADSAAPQVTETTRVVAVKKRVPHVEGLSLGQATKRLLTRGLVVGDVSKRVSAKPRRTVLDQSRRPGSKAKPGARVALVVAKPFPRVPDTVAEGRRAAGRELRLAGFHVLKTRQRTDSASPGTVIEQSPTGGARAKPGATVTITIAKKPPPPPPPPPTVQEDNCTSGYSPCLPPASDYDCAGGSGDGPAYAEGPIAVTGSDPYGLDDDSDGVGCE